MFRRATDQCARPAGVRNEWAGAACAAPTLGQLVVVLLPAELRREGAVALRVVADPCREDLLEASELG
jgi:hypothetical protein